MCFMYKLTLTLTLTTQNAPASLLLHSKWYIPVNRIGIKEIVQIFESGVL